MEVTARDRPALAVWPVALIAGTVTIGLLLLSQWHGFHRDELYFIVAGRHPAFGYPDQPPLTPLLSEAMTVLLGVEPFAVRLLPALGIGATVALIGCMARDLGGGGRAQIVAAVTAGLSGLLAAGHLGSTATYEVLLWTLVIWLVVRLLDGSDPRWWLVVGVLSGLALQNKQTALILGAGLAGGLVLARRWNTLRSPMLWLGGAVALLIWSPNLIWQVANGFPQLEMARGIAGEAGENRAMLIPELLLLAGPLLFPVSIAGAWWLLRAPEAKPWRAVPAAFAVVLLLVLLTGGKSYYASGYLGPLMAAGSIPVAAWLGRGRMRLRGALLGTAAIVSGVLIATLTLPVVPPPMLAKSPLPEIYAETAEQIGWPELVETVEAAISTLTEDERTAAVVLTANYGEAAAVELLGSGSVPVHSGHNGYWDWGPPSEEMRHTVVVGMDPSPWRVLGDCALVGRVDNGVDLDNEEQGASVWVCRDRLMAWSEIWPELRHLN